MPDGTPRRLLFVANSTRFFVSHRLNIARAAHSTGFDVHVAAPLDADAAILAAEGVTTHSTPLSRSGLNPLADARALGALYRLYRRLRPDVVHHVHVKPVAYGPAAARAARVPAVVNAITGLGYAAAASGVRPQIAWRVQQIAFRGMRLHRNQRVIVQNMDDADLFRRILGRRAAEVVIVPGSGVDPDRFRPSPEPARPAVLFAGRFLRTKGVDDFVAAATALRTQGCDARFLLAGEPDPGNPASVHAADVRAWGASGAVEVVGWRADMAALLAEATVACLPSYREGLPKSLLEAAACGRALVATDVPGCRDVVRPGWNGWLVPPRDRDALAGAIADALADPLRRAAMGRNSRALILERFADHHVVPAQLRLYEELLGAADT